MALSPHFTEVKRELQVSGKGVPDRSFSQTHGERQVFKYIAAAVLIELLEGWHIAWHTFDYILYISLKVRTHNVTNGKL